MTCEKHSPGQPWLLTLTRTRIIPGQAVARRGQVPRRTAVHTAAGAAVLLDMIRASGTYDGADTAVRLDSHHAMRVQMMGARWHEINPVAFHH